MAARIPRIPRRLPGDTLRLRQRSAAPGTPPTDWVDLYIRDVAGSPALYFKSDDGAEQSAGGAAALDDLSDVVITSAAIRQILNHDGSNWVNTPDPTLETLTLTPPAASTAGTFLDLSHTSNDENSSNNLGLRVFMALAPGMDASASAYPVGASVSIGGNDSNDVAALWGLTVSSRAFQIGVAEDVIGISVTVDGGTKNTGTTTAVTGLSIVAGTADRDVTTLTTLDVSGPRATNASGAVATGYGIHVGVPTTTGTFTDLYGVKIENYPTTQWAFFTGEGKHQFGSSTTNSLLGFHGATPVAQQTVTGSRGANAALASLLTALATLGLIVDSTS